MKFGVVITVILVLAAGIYVVSDKKPPPKSVMGTASNSVETFRSLTGKPAPDFTLTSYDGKSYTLSQFRGKRVVLFFNEGIMCYPACWNQIAALGKDPNLNTSDTVTLSIVPDLSREWVEAVYRMPDLGKETILLDNTLKVSNTYGMLNLPSSMHKGSKPGHTYVIVDPSGIVRYAQDDINMGIQNKLLVTELSKI